MVLLISCTSARQNSLEHRFTVHLKQAPKIKQWRWSWITTYTPFLVWADICFLFHRPWSIYVPVREMYSSRCISLCGQPATILTGVQLEERKKEVNKREALEVSDRGRSGVGWRKWRRFLSALFALEFYLCPSLSPLGDCNAGYYAQEKNWKGLPLRAPINNAVPSVKWFQD